MTNMIYYPEYLYEPCINTCVYFGAIHTHTHIYTSIGRDLLQINKEDFSLRELFSKERYKVRYKERISYEGS